ncbi:hypothetical protein Tco_0953329 [Tanacetum coccineum]|uniref:Uncharacterized protein n=1 Tax=Tanacetum coccineum TaxID=301880 RepID=A0ABQ5E0I9_9ASTR
MKSLLEICRSSHHSQVETSEFDSTELVELSVRVHSDVYVFVIILSYRFAFASAIATPQLATTVNTVTDEELQGRYGYLFEHLKAKFLSKKSFDTLVDHLQECKVSQRMLAEGMLLERAIVNKGQETLLGLLLEAYVPQTTCRTSVVRPRDQDDPHDDAPPEGENNAKRKKTSEYEAYSYASDDDEIPMKQVSQDIMEEVSLTINEAELKKIADEMLRQRYEHERNSCILKSREDHTSRSKLSESILEAQHLSLINQESMLSRHIGKLGHEHKFITEIVAEVKKMHNEYIVAITEFDYMNLSKNDIRYLLVIMNGKVPDYAETGLLWSLSVFIRSSVIWERVHDFQLGIESYQQKVNLTAPTISFPGVEKHKMFSIIYEPVHGIIYKNSKKEKRVMRHSEIHKFCDATLNRVLEGLRSYNNDVKYGYIQRDLTNEEVEYLKLFEEEIEVRLKYRNQMRRWEMYVNGRPLGPRRERPE